MGFQIAGLRAIADVRSLWRHVSYQLEGHTPRGIQVALWEGSGCPMRVAQAATVPAIGKRRQRVDSPVVETQPASPLAAANPDKLGPL